MNLPEIVKEESQLTEHYHPQPHQSEKSFSTAYLLEKEYLSLGPYKFLINNKEREPGGLWEITLSDKINVFSSLEEAMAALVIDDDDTPFLYRINPTTFSAGPDWPFQVIYLTWEAPQFTPVWQHTYKVTAANMATHTHSLEQRAMMRLRLPIKESRYHQYSMPESWSIADYL